MAQSFFPVERVDITPAPDEDFTDWVSISVFGNVPSDATGVILHCHNPTNYYVNFGLRPGGSTLNLIPSSTSYTSRLGFWAVVGITNSTFQVFDYNIQYPQYKNLFKIYLVGYTMEGVETFTNPINKTPEVLNEWVTIDCSGDAPVGTTGLIFEYLERRVFLKHPDATPYSIYTSVGRIGWMIVGCNANREVKAYSGTDSELYLTGYVTEGISFIEPRWETPDIPVDIWTPVQIIPTGGVVEVYRNNVSVTLRIMLRGITLADNVGSRFALYELQATGDHRLGLRKEGASNDLVHRAYVDLGMVKISSYAEAGGYEWVEGDNLAYLDYFRTKRLAEGSLTGVTGKLPGYTSVDATYKYYVDATGAVRRIQGTLTGLTGKLPSQISINLAQGGTKYCYIDSTGAERCFEGTAA